MGKEIVYCGGCGAMLRENDFALGLGHRIDHRPFCSRCRPLSTPTFPVGERDPVFVPPFRLGRSRSA